MIRENSVLLSQKSHTKYKAYHFKFHRILRQINIKMEYSIFMMNRCSVCRVLVIALLLLPTTTGNLLDYLYDTETYEEAYRFDQEHRATRFIKPSSDEYQLRQRIMAEYSSDMRPVLNASTVTYVNISLNNMQIINLDEQNQVIIISALMVLVSFASTVHVFCKLSILRQFCVYSRNGPTSI
jgi:hypothetical protein